MKLQRILTSKFLWRLFAYICLIVGGFLALFPFYWMILNSLKPGWALTQWPPSFLPYNLTLENYRYVFKFANIARAFFNSLIVSVSVVVSNVVLSSMTAYALAKLRFPGRELLFWIIIATMMLPFQILMMPLYLLMSNYSLLDTYWALILPTVVSAFSIFLLRQGFLSVPDDYIDAAKIDGASHFRILFTIIFSMTKPIIITVMIINLYWTWNSFLWPYLVIIHDEMTTLPVMLARFQGVQSYDEMRWGAIMAASTLTAAPLVIAYLFAQKKFVEAVSLSGLKM